MFNVQLDKQLPFLFHRYHIPHPTSSKQLQTMDNDAAMRCNSANSNPQNTNTMTSTTSAYNQQHIGKLRRQRTKKTVIKPSRASWKQKRKQWQQK